MKLDHENQRTNILACIQVTVQSGITKADDASLSRLAALVQLRREVEAAEIAPAEKPVRATA